MSKEVYFVIRGTVDWCKMVGDPRPHTGNPKYDKGPYWSVDVTPDTKSRALLKQHGVDGKLRDPNPEYEKEHRKESFLTLRHLENRSDGKKNEPPKISDGSQKVWDGRKIGNGSICDIKVKMVDYGKGSDRGLYFQAMRVLKLVPYEVDDFAPLSEDDEFFASRESEVGDEVKGLSNPDDLEDDVPF